MRNNPAPEAPSGDQPSCAPLLVAILLAFLAFILPPGPRPRAAGEPIGFVRNLSGTAAILRGADTIPAAEGTKLHVGDTLATGPDGSLGAIFRDNSSISMGPDSSFVVRNFEFAPDEGKIGLLIRITKGSLAYLSGLIGKLSPESARFETPTATIGIRGTRFAVQVGEPVPQ